MARKPLRKGKSGPAPHSLETYHHLMTQPYHSFTCQWLLSTRAAETSHSAKTITHRAYTIFQLFHSRVSLQTVHFSISNLRMHPNCTHPRTWKTELWAPLPDFLIQGVYISRWWWCYWSTLRTTEWGKGWTCQHEKKSCWVGLSEAVRGETFLCFRRASEIPQVFLSLYQARLLPLKGFYCSS